MQRAPALCRVWGRVSVASLTLACAMRGDRDSNPGPSMCLLYMHFKLLFYFNRGGFELQRTGRSPELCDGFQAHLSCSASQLVLDVVKKFPSKVQLEEVPRQNSWPTQFQENGPTYDNIGLFFFARDVQRCVVCSFSPDSYLLHSYVVFNLKF